MAASGSPDAGKPPAAPGAVRAGLAIRPAGPPDAAAIWRIYNQGIEDHLATFATEMAPLSEVQRWLDGAPERRASGVRVLLAENLRQPVGWGSLAPYREGAVFAGIAEMAVYVERAWRQHAVGQLLGEALISEARAKGLDKLVGYLLEQNISSRKLVEKLGFRLVGTHLNHVRRAGGGSNVLVVEKLL